jgi:hypothetical protein
MLTPRSIGQLANGPTGQLIQSMLRHPRHRIDFCNAQKNHCTVRHKGNARISREPIKDRRRKTFFGATAMEIVINIKRRYRLCFFGASDGQSTQPAFFFSLLVSGTGGDSFNEGNIIQSLN